MELSAKEGRSAGAGGTVSGLWVTVYTSCLRGTPRWRIFRGLDEEQKQVTRLLGMKAALAVAGAGGKALRGRGDFGASGAEKGGGRSIRGVRGSQDEHPWK